MELHFRNLEYVTPPGSLTETLPHPYFSSSQSVELAMFNEHRYAFFFWNKWTQKLIKEKNSTNPPCLVTLDWHQDLMWPNDTEKQWLDDLDLSNNMDVSLYAWANLTPINDGQIMAAAYLNLIGNVYVHCRQGEYQDDWEDQQFEDKYGNIHTIRRYKEYSMLEKELLKSDESKVYFDIDLDFFTLNNPYSGIGKSYTYLTKSQILEMLAPGCPLINWIFEKLCGFTIATEPEHTGGVLQSNRLLDMLNKLYFKSGLFSNYGDNWAKSANWKHLKR